MQVSHLAATIIIFRFLLGSPAQAEWVDATGEATIINGNTKQAREEAITQAINYATLGRGIQVTSEQQLVNGQLTQNTFAINRNSQANNIQLLHERIKGDTLIVSLRLEISDDLVPQCPDSQVKAAILIPQAQVRDRAQLRHGQIANLGTAVSEKLGYTIDTYSSTSFSHTHAKELLDINSALVDIRGYRLPSWLSETTDSQYIMIPRLIDVSTEPAKTRLLGLIEYAPLRQFQFELSLYHGISGEKVWHKVYDTAAAWEFEEQEIISPNSDRFWRSTYGKNINQQLQKAIKDMDSALNCRPLLGQVISRQADRIILNLGRKHGIKIGDKFQVILQQNQPDRFNMLRALAMKSEATVTVDQISEESATAILLDQNAAYNVQISDIAIKI